MTCESYEKSLLRMGDSQIAFSGMLTRNGGETHAMISNGAGTTTVTALLSGKSVATQYMSATVYRLAAVFTGLDGASLEVYLPPTSLPVIEQTPTGMSVRFCAVHDALYISHYNYLKLDLYGFQTIEIRNKVTIHRPLFLDKASTFHIFTRDVEAFRGYLELAAGNVKIHREGPSKGWLVIQLDGDTDLGDEGDSAESQIDGFNIRHTLLTARKEFSEVLLPTEQRVLIDTVLSIFYCNPQYFRLCNFMVGQQIDSVATRIMQLLEDKEKLHELLESLQQDERDNYVRAIGINTIIHAFSLFFDAHLSQEDSGEGAPQDNDYHSHINTNLIYLENSNPIVLRKEVVSTLKSLQDHPRVAHVVILVKRGTFTKKAIIDFLQKEKKERRKLLNRDDKSMAKLLGKSHNPGGKLATRVDTCGKDEQTWLVTESLIGDQDREHNAGGLHMFIDDSGRKGKLMASWDLVYELKQLLERLDTVEVMTSELRGPAWQSAAKTLDVCGSPGRKVKERRDERIPRSPPPLTALEDAAEREASSDVIPEVERLILNVTGRSLPGLLKAQEKLVVDRVDLGAREVALAKAVDDRAAPVSAALAEAVDDRTALVGEAFDSLTTGLNPGGLIATKKDLKGVEGMPEEVDERVVESRKLRKIHSTPVRVDSDDVSVTSSSSDRASAKKQKKKVERDFLESEFVLALQKGDEHDFRRSVVHEVEELRAMGTSEGSAHRIAGGVIPLVIKGTSDGKNKVGGTFSFLVNETYMAAQFTPGAAGTAELNVEVLPETGGIKPQRGVNISPTFSGDTSVSKTGQLHLSKIDTIKLKYREGTLQGWHLHAYEKLLVIYLRKLIVLGLCDPDAEEIAKLWNPVIEREEVQLTM